MLKLIQFDIKLLIKSRIWAVFYLVFILFFCVMIPITSAHAIQKGTSLINLDQTLFFMLNIMTFLTFAAPLSRNNVSNIGGNYSMVLFSMPISRRAILNGKYLFLGLYSVAASLLVFLVSLITFLVMGKLPTLVFVENLLQPVISSTLIFGSLYLLSFLTSKRHHIISMIIYFTSLFSYLAFTNNAFITFSNYSETLLVISILFLVISYFIAYFRFPHRSY